MADRRLQVFFAVAKQGSFTKAAESLFMTQPAVTFQIKQLEEQFNCRLFERQHQKIALTPAGQLVFEYAGKILALSDEMENRVADLTGQMGGALAVGASSTLGESLLPSILGEFNEQHPQVRLRLVVGNSEAIVGRVAESALDLGFVDCPVSPRLVAVEPIVKESLRVVCDARYPLAGQKAARAAELVDYEYVSRETGSGTRDSVEHYFRSVGVPPEQLKVVMELGSPGALKGVVKSGLGFAIMSVFAVADEVARGELVTVALDPPLERELSMIMPKERFRSRTISVFADFIKRRLRAAAG